MYQMLCKEIYFSYGDYYIQKSRTGQVVLVEGLMRNVIAKCMKLFQIKTRSSDVA